MGRNCYGPKCPVTLVINMAHYRSGLGQIPCLAGAGMVRESVRAHFKLYCWIEILPRLKENVDLCLLHAGFSRTLSTNLFTSLVSDS